jgi:hypothetical protein
MYLNAGRQLQCKPLNSNAAYTADTCITRPTKNAINLWTTVIFSVCRYGKIINFATESSRFVACRTNNYIRMMVLTQHTLFRYDFSTVHYTHI